MASVPEDSQRSFSSFRIFSASDTSFYDNVPLAQTRPFQFSPEPASEPPASLTIKSNLSPQGPATSVGAFLLPETIGTS